MGELAKIASAADQLGRKLARIDELFKQAEAHLGHHRGLGLRKQGADGDLWPGLRGQGLAKRGHSAALLGSAASFWKGYPEFDPDQPRDEGGRFSDSGDGGSDMRRLFGFPGDRLTIRNRAVRAAVAAVAALGLLHLPMAAKAVNNILNDRPWYHEIAVPTAELHRHENERVFEGLKDKGYRFERQPDGTYKVLPPVGKGYPEFNRDQERDEQGRFTDGGGGGKPDKPREFYRGTNPGDTRRIKTDREDWDKHLFAADSVKGASWYGSQIERITAKPEARILYEGTREFRSLAKGLGKLNLLQQSAEIANRAKAAGWHAVWFKRQTDVGTVILDRSKFDFHGPITKGYPEFRPDQPRDEGGRFAGGGGASTGLTRGSEAVDLLNRNLELKPTPSKAEFLASLKPEQRAYIRKTLARLKGLKSTDQDPRYVKADGTWKQSRKELQTHLVQTRLHDAMHRAFPDEGERPKLVIMGGRPGSGKTTSLMESGFVPNMDDYLYVNADDLRGDNNKWLKDGNKDFGLPGYEGWNSMLYHKEASELARRLEADGMSMGLNIIHDATMRDIGASQELMDKAEAAGYDVSILYVHTTPENAAMRVISRAMGKPTGRFVPTYILGDNINEAAFDAVKDRAREWKLYDANGRKAKLIASNTRRARAR